MRDLLRVALLRVWGVVRSAHLGRGLTHAQDPIRGTQIIEELALIRDFPVRSRVTTVRGCEPVQCLNILKER